MKDKTGTALWRTRQKASPCICHQLKGLEANRNTKHSVQLGKTPLKGVTSHKDKHEESPEESFEILSDNDITFLQQNTPKSRRAAIPATLGDSLLCASRRLPPSPSPRAHLRPCAERRRRSQPPRGPSSPGNARCALLNDVLNRINRNYQASRVFVSVLIVLCLFTHPPN
jgi:hypothetical protein